MSTNRQKCLYFGLAFAVAAAAAAIIFIIVDKTSYCRDPVLPENAAGIFDSGEGTIICLPGYVFVDGNTTHNITCSSPPTWDLEDVPECIPANPPLALRCPIHDADDSNLSGEVLFVQKKDHIQVSGHVDGLDSSTIRLINVDNHTALCYITEPPVSSVMSTEIHSASLDVTGSMVNIDLMLEQPLKMNETFSFYARAIGFQRELRAKSSKFDGIFLFIVEQEERTVGVFSTKL